MEKELVYVCSPLRADTAKEQEKNMGFAKICAESISEAFECKAIAPHAYFPEFLDDTNPKEREIAMTICKNIINSCEFVFVIGERISEGMQVEIFHAKYKNIPVFRIKNANDFLDSLKCGNTLKSISDFTEFLVGEDD